MCVAQKDARRTQCGIPVLFETNLPQRRFWIDILEAAQAEKLGYQDGDKYTQNDGVVYINGFDSPSALNTFIEDLHGCVNRSEAMAAHQREER